ncbi:MAG: DoxX family protein [Thermomicrobiales bacterium]
MISLGLLLMRIATGGVYVLHGLPKLIGGEGSGKRIPEDVQRKLGHGFVGSMEKGGVENIAKMLDSLDVPNPPMMAWVLSLTEFLGGLALIFGWKTRVAALGLTVVQVVAISKVHAPQGASGSEFNGLLLAATGALALTGPGKVAID